MHRSIRRKLAMIVTGLVTTAVLVSGCGKEPVTAANESGANDEHSHAEQQQAAGLPRTPAPAGARAFFITPADGATVSNPVSLEFGLEGMTVTAAGDNQPNSGHHHLLINTGLPDLSMPIPADEQHKHFGDGSTTTEITLEPGTHTLQLLLGDYLHIPHDPPVSSAPITITVE